MIGLGNIEILPHRKRFKYIRVHTSDSYCEGFQLKQSITLGGGEVEYNQII